MSATHKSILSILLINKKHFNSFSIGFKLYIIICQTRFVHCLIIDNRNIEIINKARYLQKQVGVTGSKSKINFTSLKNVFTTMYNSVICRIDALLNDIKLNIKFLKVFIYK